MSATKNGNGRKSHHEPLAATVEEISPPIAKRVNGKLPHPSTTGNSTPAGIAAHDPTAESFSDEPPTFKPLSGKTLERDYGGKTLSTITLDKCVRHPDNRQPTDEAVAKMAASIEKEGLLDPLVVRGLAGGKWQIISGETRYLALKKLGRKACDGHVLHCDDARALELLATYNAERTDLNCIEKARLINRLCQPKEQGGGGMTREQAAKIYGLETGAAASNLVGLLKLPKVWQERVISGEFPQTFARCLVPYCASPSLMEEIDREYRKAMKGNEWDREDWERRENLEDVLQNIAHEHTRPMEGKGWHYSQKQVGEYMNRPLPVLFEVTEKVERDLQIVTLKMFGEEHRYATNVKLYDSLQIPLVKAKLAKGKKAAVGASDEDDEPAKKKPPTPAELKAKAKEQQRVLEQRIERWRHRWLRNLCAAEIERQRCLDWQVLKVVLWLASQPGWASHSDEEAAGLNKALCAAAGQPVKKIHEAGWGRTRHETWDPLHAKCHSKQGYHDHMTDLGNVARSMVIKMLRTDDLQPGRYLVPAAVVEGLAADLSIDLADAWIKLQHASDRTELETFFELHNGEQLDELAKELGVVASAAKKSEKVRILAASASSGRLLKLPKAIKPLPAPESSAAGKKKKGKS